MKSLFVCFWLVGGVDAEGPRYVDGEGERLIEKETARSFKHWVELNGGPGAFGSEMET